MVPVLVLAAVVVLASATPGYAAGGTNVLTNGNFEASGGSLTGWTSVSSKVSLAADGDGGGSAALVSVRGKAKATTYGLTTSSSPVTGAPAGEAYAATGKVRSASPGKNVCLVIQERSPGGSVVQASQQCAATTAAWAPLPTATLTVRSGGDAISLIVQQPNGAASDTFEADTLTLVDTDTSAPTVPTGLNATAPSASEVDLSWQPATDAGGGGVSGYTVFRDGVAVASVGSSSTAYRDTNVTAGTSYSYTVAAFDFARNTSAQSAPATVRTPDPPADSPPSVPSNLVANAKSASEVDLSWNASTDTDGTGVAGYAITRNGSPFATVNAPAATFADTSTSPSTTYSYTVAAFDTAQNASAPAGPVSVTTPPATTVNGADDVWHLNETSGTTMVDSGQTPHPGVLHNIALAQPGDPSFPGTSYGFNGTSSFVSIPDAPDLNAGGKDIRIGLSLKTTTVPPQPDYDLFRKGEYPGTEYKLELQPNGQFSCEFRTLQADGTVKGYTIQPALDLHDGNWHRLTCSKVGGTMTVTVDGAAFTKSITGTISNPQAMIIGAYSATGGGDFYQGLLDEITFRTG